MEITGNAIVDPALLIQELGKWGKWIQAIGLFIILWLIIQVANFIVNVFRKREIIKIKKSLERVEDKLDKLSKKRKK